MSANKAQEEICVIQEFVLMRRSIHLSAKFDV